MSAPGVGRSSYAIQGSGDGHSITDSENFPDSKGIVHDDEPDGFFGRLGHGLRSIWATRQTEETAGNRELFIRTTLRELVVYIVFLILLMIITFGMNNPTMYYFTNALSNQFLQGNVPNTNPPLNLQGIGVMDDWWNVMNNSLLASLYGSQWYNSNPFTQDMQNYILYQNKLLGGPRLRQVRVRSDSCTIAPDFAKTVTQCYASYDKSIEDTKPFGEMTLSAWNYTAEKNLTGSSFAGQVATYGGGGYYIDLSNSLATALAILQELNANTWTDRATRAVFLDFTVYNPNINLFCVIKLVAEMPATGGAILSYEFRTVKLIRYVSSMDYFVLACECLYLAFILYYIIEEIIEIRKQRLTYFTTNVWNWLDIIVILLSLICTGFNIYRTIAVSTKLQSLLNNSDLFPNFEFLSYWQLQFNNALAILSFLAWVKMFKYISFNKTMNQLSETLAKCAKDLAGFALMFFIIFFAFAQLGYLIFGSQVTDFRDFIHSVYCLFRIILGDFNFQALEQANRVLGPLYFLLYVFFVFFVLINMFLAIINDTYSDVKDELAKQANEFEVADYFKQRATQVMAKLNMKRDKIVGIQKAMNMADADGDGKIDFEEWRTELKSRGYADAEIEAVFAKYDTDGDRQLDADEQAQMLDILDKQKKDLSNEIEKERLAVPAASSEQLTTLSSRVDRIELSVGNIANRIDDVLSKLEEAEKTKIKRREQMGLLLDSMNENTGLPEEQRRVQMESIARDELDQWGSVPGAGRIHQGPPAGASRQSRLPTGLGWPPGSD